VLRVVCFLATLWMSVAAAVAEPASGRAGVRWQGWSDNVFERARRENRLVLLDLEAVWCHWCHVMEEKTYGDPAVIKLLDARFIPVKVDQDSRPDLSNRYEEYGWPATIIFNGQGAELAKRDGYIPADEMAALLARLVRNPVPEETAGARPVSYSRDAFLSASLASELRAKLADGYDTRHGGWGTSPDGQKFLDWDTVEYCLARARQGDRQCERMARETLSAQLKLIDPVWGGVYQYSTHGDWDHPHFEKIMSVQAGNMRVYGLAYMLWKDPAYLRAAERIHDYLKTFLMSPDGAFYTSQDADLVKGRHSTEYFKLDDARRRARGIPRVDKHLYARENGWAIEALACLHAATGDKAYLREALRAADWVVSNRSLAGGGFRHDAADTAGPYLCDTLAAGRAFLSLYAVSGDRRWLTRARQAADFLAVHFKVDGKNAQGAGLSTADAGRSPLGKPLAVLEENVAAARFLNLLYHYDGNKADRRLADEAMRYLATPEIARQRHYLVAGILLADAELASEPVHITVVGGKDDPQARLLFLAAISYPAAYKRVEWWDRREGPLPNMDVEYPEMRKAAAFACANNRCSLPVYEPQGVAAMVDRLSGRL